ncbi:hypothetical protein LSCM1_04061 [Leishmania martiniquensis]|uniref:Uncharacterized protein n=1 Tax=Leishmania martiniquensis TaxID=1580590 RepID=A0A836KHN7_9TRYP|nr:hypothetical protein LSCM1_04061 [Leishmania martiniquensis]
MSSNAKGGAGAGSHNDSIPLDVEESSMSIYSGDGDEDYDPSSQLSEDAVSSLDYSSVSRTYLTHSRTSVLRANSEDYTGTASYYSNGGAASNSFGYDDEDYSSGYGSLTYGDSALRSPQSELSSTFASLYYENKYVVGMRATLHFLRRPLYYLAFATAGSGAVGSVCRLTTTFAKRFVDSSVSIADSSMGGYADSAARCGGIDPSLPSGCLSVPEWLRDVRASLPSVLEVPAAWMLRRYGIPILSETMQRQQRESAATAAAGAMAAQVSSGVQEVWQSWQRTGPAIPVALFLPIFSIVVFKVAQCVRPRPGNVTEMLRPQRDADDVDVASADVKTPSHTRPSLIMDASPIQASSASPGNASAPSASIDILPASQGAASAPMSRASAAGGGSKSQQAHLTVPPVDIAAATNAFPLEPRVSASFADDVSPSSPEEHLGNSNGRSRSTTQAPLTHRHVADAAVQNGGWEDYKATGLDADADAAPSLPVSLSPSPPHTENGYNGASESPEAAASAASSSVSPPPRVPHARSNGTTAGRLISVKDSTLRGEVVAAVAGAVDVREANVAFTAAVRYGCSAVVLPSMLRDAGGLLEAPPSLTVEFADDVLAAATVLSDRRGLMMVGVTAQHWDAQAVPLDIFAHPGNALYLFVANESSCPAVVADVEARVIHSVFVGTTRTEVPVNQVFYDRLLKERAVQQRQQQQGEALPQR